MILPSSRAVSLVLSLAVLAVSVPLPSGATEPATSTPHRKGPGTKGPAKKGPDQKNNNVDWRGLNSMDADGHTKKREKPPPNPVQRLVQNAPYRVHVATTNGKKITITDAFTLERRRVFVADSIAGYAFSSDGELLYVVHGTGPTRQVSVVRVATARARPLTTLKLRRGEGVIEVLGGGGTKEIRLTVVLGVGTGWRLGAPCTTARKLRRVALRRPSSGRGAGKLRIEHKAGGPERRFPARRRRVSPNTRYTVELGANLMIHGRFGTTGVDRLNRKALPSGSLGVRWMRDSRGVFVINRRKGACRHLKGLTSFRQPASQYASWRRQHDWVRWSAPADVQLVRGDLAAQDLLWAPDGMRAIGITPRGVVVVEPVPRQQAHVSLIAPPSLLWPAVRPGVRTLATGSGGLRHAEILLEQGSLDAAEAKLKASAAAGARANPGAAATAAQRARLLARLAKLRRVQARRAKEFSAPAETP